MGSRVRYLTGTFPVYNFLYSHQKYKIVYFVTNSIFPLFSQGYKVWTEGYYCVILGLTVVGYPHELSDPQSTMPAGSLPRSATRLPWDRGRAA